MVVRVNNDISELQQVISEAFSGSNGSSFVLSAARKGNQAEDLPKLNKVNELFQDQNISISLTPKGGDSTQYLIVGFKSAEWQVEKNGSRKLLVSSRDKQKEPLEISNSQTTIKFEKLSEDLETKSSDAETRITPQLFNQTSQAETLRAFHQGLVRTAAFSGKTLRSDISPQEGLQWYLKFLKQNRGGLDEANKAINEKFSDKRIALYINGKHIQGIDFLSNTPLTINDSKRNSELGIKDSAGIVHKLIFNDNTMLRIVENPLSKEETQLARAVDTNNQESEWGREFLRDVDNLRQVNERLLQEGFLEGSVSIYKNNDLKKKIKSLRVINPLSWQEKGFVIYDALDQAHLINLSDNDILRIVKKKPKAIKTYLLDPVETRVAAWKSFLEEFLKKTHQSSKPSKVEKEERLEFDFSNSVKPHQLSQACKQLLKEGFLKSEVEFYSAGKQIYKGFLRGSDPLVYDNSKRQLMIYDPEDKPTVIRRANFKVTVVKTNKLIPQTLNLKADSVQDFVKQLNGFLARLSDSCTLKIEGLKGPQGQDLSLDSNTRVSWQRLNPPHEVWILNENPYKIEPELGRRYNCSVEKLKQSV